MESPCGCELSSCGYCWEENQNIEHMQPSCCNMKASVNSVSKESSAGEEGSGKIPNAVHNVVSASSDQDDDDASQKFLESLSLGTKAQKCLSKCNTFPVSRDVPEHSLLKGAVSIGGNDQDSSPSGISTYSRSLSLSSSSSTVISAMKGGRALNGGTIKPELLHVKWAPEAYDPPSTSMSHTVNGRQQRSKSKKKDKLKSKGKSARRNGGEKKHGNCKGFNKAPEPLNVRLPGSGLDGFGKSEGSDVLEYGINAQEGKCGSSFLIEALSKVHFPMGEAS